MSIYPLWASRQIFKANEVRLLAIFLRRALSALKNEEEPWDGQHFANDKIKASFLQTSNHVGFFLDFKESP
jgi:hypothetical protein